MRLRKIEIQAPQHLIEMVEKAAKQMEQTIDSFTSLAWMSLLTDTSVNDKKSVESTSNGDIMSQFPNLHIEAIDWEQIQIVPGDRIVSQSGFLWGQFHRYLPIKFTLRILATMLLESESDRVSISDWSNNVRKRSHAAYELLRKADTYHKKPRGTQLASGFPNPKVGGGDALKIEKSLNRFCNHFTTIVQDDGQGRVTGMCAEMGFINVKCINGNCSVGLTNMGKKFAELPSPVFDEKRIQKFSLSELERSFLIAYMQENLVDDWKMMNKILLWIKDGKDDTTKLDEIMEQHYGPGSEYGFSETEYPTYKGGAMGRLTELGLLGRTWENRTVRYRVNDFEYDKYMALEQ